MARVTIGLGAILIVLGVISYIATGFASWTALIPAILGAIVLICGLIALKNATVGLILGLVVAVLGVLGTAMNVMQIAEVFAGDAERPMAVIVSTITFVLLIVYVIVAIRALVTSGRQRSLE